jgi:hypothetical protein
LRPSQPQHRELRAPGFENPYDSVDAHCHSMRSANEAVMNVTLRVL